MAGSPGAGTAEGVACDLSSLASVRAAAESVLAEHEAVDALVLCAGAALWGSAGPPRLTADGIEASSAPRTALSVLHSLLPAPARLSVSN